MELGINLQDVRIPISKNNTLRLIRNQRGKLTYIPEDIWNSSVKEIARHNKEIKISGQDGNHKINSDNDPRVIPNNVELEKRFGEEFMTKKKQNIVKILEDQPLTREKLEHENLKTNRERNEIEWQRLNLERRKLHMEETQRT